MTSNGRLGPGIAKLNDDVLRFLFTFSADIEPLRISPSTNDICLGWVLLTHVCRRWRLVICNMGELWAANLCCIPAAFDTFLSRAGGRPLTFDYPLRCLPPLPPPQAIIDLALHHIERVSQLCVPLGYRGWTALHDRPLPCLQRICFLNFRERTPEGTIRLNSPNLKEVNILYMPVAFLAPKLSSLVVSMHPTSPLLLLETLAHSPSLQHLALHITTSAPNPWDNYTGDIIHLSRLLELKIAIKGPTGASGFLRRVRVANNVNIHVSAQFPFTLDPATIAALAPYILNPGFDTLRLQYSAFQNLYGIEVFVHGTAVHDNNMPDHPRVNLYWVGWHAAVQGEIPDGILDSYSRTLQLALDQSSADRIDRIELEGMEDIYASGFPPVRDAIHRFSHAKKVLADVECAEDHT
ncbi:hypothetical protein K488DRAFT_88241 [Vararia minispora EC-137]|uniref:Uncharacterized protein n=1 Tax=Vararia minispora EC-137 TaxID=1314806 RepID=A0ACB8QE34_9AGAM|nr:hypothetical protein K488DRAFT_88241 [Vararia minispora EC-137]